MSTSNASASERATVLIELEFVRSQEADDAFAFRFTRQTYLVRGRQGAYETAELPWSRELLRDLDEIREPDRDPATVARVGALLREFLAPAGWAGHEKAIVDARAARRRVHLTIRSAAAELYALPWELLTLRADGQHLGALDHVLLRYAWPGTSTVEADADAGTRGPGRILMAWSAAGGGIPAAEQQRAIEAAVEATSDGDPDALEVVANASYGAIADALEAAARAGRPFRVLHLLAHGAQAGSTFGLSLDAEGDGRPVVVDAGRLQQLLAPHAHALRLVVVAACDGGNQGEPGNRIGSVAQRLHRAGLQDVVASRYPLSARGSTRVTTALYQALLAGEPLERAFVRARSAASREVTQLDWASVQLYARPEDGDRTHVLGPKVEAAASGTAAGPAVVPAAVSVAGVGPRRSSSVRWIVAAFAVVAVLWIFWELGDPKHDVDGPEAVGGTAPAASGGHVDAERSGSTGPPSGETTAPAAEVEPRTEADTKPEAGTTAGTGAGTGAGTRAGSGGSTGGTAAELHRPSSSVRRPPDTSPPKDCDPVLTSYLNDLLDSKAQGRPYKVTVSVGAEGRMRLDACKGCDALSDTARERLRGGRASTAVRKAKGTLPCRARFEWKQ